ncbi:MAG: hypothetical protein JO069_13490 [Verrucomicrobia bacterium]|nr:hypothetical protein [Verrucomicrobiota bacterium]
MSKTLLFEYSSLDGLAGYFLEHHLERLTQMWPDQPGTRGDAHELTSEAVPNKSGVQSSSRFLIDLKSSESDEDVAIIGLFGRYPQAGTLDEFWANLVEGKDCIEEIPLERWDYRFFFDPEPGKPGRTYNKWGGFVRDVDRFDPLFFGISPREAEVIDPQERLFLETVWNTLEDAGYSRRALMGRKVGVFVGVMYGQYQLFGVEESLRRGEVTTLSSSYASIANRVSYFFDWRGPSAAIDTMCSSALMSIHLACESLKRGESELAIAGGVNLILHPHKDVGLAQAGFLNEEGRCRSFGQTQGRGYVPGEGVGSVLLKPLRAAIRDRDQVYGVIKATSINHGGRTNGYAVPSPNAQAEVIVEALQKAGVDARTIGYIEAAATGSMLGDPIEISGLTKAFQLATSATDRQFCAIGAVKANIGHLESASAMAALTKVLLQLRHRKLVPSIHTEKLNPTIRWEETPFCVQRRLGDWEAAVIDGRPQPRRAGVNAFGAGGTNGHLIIEEYADPRDQLSHDPRPFAFPVLIVLSAQDGSRLAERSSALSTYLRAAATKQMAPLRLLDLAYTLQVGREPMEERLAFVADCVEVVGEKLAAFAGGTEGIAGLHRGRPPVKGLSGQIEAAVAPPPPVLDQPIRSQSLDKLAAWWVSGGEFDWEILYQGYEPRRISLPAYPFARERCWFRDAAAEPGLPTAATDRGDGKQPAELVTEHQVRTAVRRSLEALLKISSGRIDPRRPLAEYGLDSVTTVAFLRVLKQKHGFEVDPGSLVEHSTLEGFARFLFEHRLQAPPLPDSETSLPVMQHDDVPAAPEQGVDGEHGTNGDNAAGAEAAATPWLALNRPRRLALGPLDYLFVAPDRLAIQVLYYFERHLDFAGLRSGLLRVAESFYPVNSQLVRSDDEQYLIAECADEPDFQEVRCERETAAPREDSPESLAPFRIPFNPLLPEAKLAKFRLFQLGTGSVLSVNVSHAVADGYSFYYFLSAWAAACRSETMAAPDLSRAVFAALARRYRGEQRAGGGPADPDGADACLSFLEQAGEPATARLETLRFDAAARVTEARESAGKNNGYKITENSLLTALVWQAYARALPADAGKLMLACPIDFRRVIPELSPTFFGNASTPALLCVERGQVLDEPVARLAAMIFDAIRRCDEQTLMRRCVALDDVRRAQGLDALRRVVLVSPNNGLIVTNVARFQLPPVDFGTGPFIRELTPVNYAGTAVIARAEGSAVNVRIAYPEFVSC